MGSSSWKYDSRRLQWWMVVIGASLPLYAEAAVIMAVAAMVLYYRKTIYVSRAIAIGFGLLALHGAVMITLTGYAPYKFMQQYVLLGGFILLYYIFFSWNRSFIKEIFAVYLRYTSFMAAAALVQFVVYLVAGVNIFGFVREVVAGAAPGSNPTVAGVLRVTSYMTEPAQFALFITPALVYRIVSDGKLVTPAKVLYLITVVLTFSTATYVIVALAIAYKYIVLRRSVVVRVGALAVALLIAGELANGMNMEEGSRKSPFTAIADKLGDSLEGFSQFDPRVFETLNLSSYATLTNMWVAVNAPYRLTGTGLGTHEQNYERIYRSNYRYYGLNKQEGFSLGNRIFSEFGVLGIVLALFFLWRYHNRRDPINVAVLFYLLTIFIRGGHYTRYGIVFFVFLYFYSGSRRLKTESGAENALP